MFKSDDYRLDWRREFERLSPYLKGRGGVIQLVYRSEDSAPLKFNHLLKEAFASPLDEARRSLRIDHEWFTTRSVDGVLDVIDRLLSEVGFEPETSNEANVNVNILKDVDVGGDMTATIEGLHINYGASGSARAFRARAEAVFDALRRYVESGGRFMVIMNDMPLPDQTEFWNRIWNGGLSASGGAKMLLVVHAGPKAQGRRHHDSPEPDERVILPDTVEDGSERDEHFYDDIFEAFDRSGIREPAGPAGVHLENNRASILHINMKLSAAIMSAKSAQGRFKA